MKIQLKKNNNLKSFHKYFFVKPKLLIKAGILLLHRFKIINFTKFYDKFAFAENILNYFQIKFDIKSMDFVCYGHRRPSTPLKIKLDTLRSDRQEKRILII
jgi:hypothetical protein